PTLCSLLHGPAAHRPLHSFPTRRSSDLRLLHLAAGTQKTRRSIEPAVETQNDRRFYAVGSGVVLGWSASRDTHQRPHTAALGDYAAAAGIRHRKPLPGRHT